MNDLKQGSIVLVDFSYSNQHQSKLRPALVDLPVEFEKMQPAEHAEQFFGLAEDLEHLLNRPVDLVEPGPIRNPYFRKSIEETQVVIYAAA
jgi:hypothetical protein